jgi:glycolate oxidase iron-sulfur subunit
VEAIVVNAAGCGAMLKEYGQLLQDDPRYAEPARAFSARVRDVSEFLVALPLARPTGELRLRVTYQDPCHLAHAQRIRQQPRELLRVIPGLQLVEMRDADRCCGSAGVYNVTQHELSLRLLQSKMANVVATGADVVASGNTGCLLQLAYGVRQAGLNVRVVHPVELLDEAYKESTYV